MSVPGAEDILIYLGFEKKENAFELPIPSEEAQQLEQVARLRDALTQLEGTVQQ